MYRARYDETKESPVESRREKPLDMTEPNTEKKITIVTIDNKN